MINNKMTRTLDNRSHNNCDTKSKRSYHEKINSFHNKLDNLKQTVSQIKTNLKDVPKETKSGYENDQLSVISQA